jgi:glutaredoxin 3
LATLSCYACSSLSQQFKQSIAKIGVGSYDAPVLNKQIDAYIKQNKVMCFSWSGCPFCRKANALLAELMEPSQFFILQIDEVDQGKAIRYELSQKTGRTSVPQIWINGQYIGGCNDGPGLLTLHKEGKLVPMLKAAGLKVKKGVN